VELVVEVEVDLHLQEVQQEQLTQVAVVEVVQNMIQLPSSRRSRRFRYRYRKRIKQGQWIVATESTI
jgi:hypothetical protein